MGSIADNFARVREQIARFGVLRIAICRKTGLPLSIWLGCAVAGSWGILNALNYRDAMNPDGISYLDMARECLRQGPVALINSYWGALYPALIAVCYLLFHPAPAAEFAYVHGLNALLYFAAAVAFGFFLRELILFRAHDRGALCKQGAFVAFGYAVFYAYTNADILPYAVTPDLLLAATEFCAAAFFFRVLRRGNRRADYLGLGSISAVGCYSKAIMLPAALVLIGVLMVCRNRRLVHLPKTMLAASIMLLLCSPQIVLLSRRAGHLTIGETGRLNYLWWVQGVRQFAGWTGTQGGDTPMHGPRLLLRDPEVLEFGEPIVGSYPLWYDPGYWYAGAKVRFNPQKQWLAFRNNVKFYRKRFADLRYPLAGLIVLIVMAISARTSPSHRECWFLLWPLAVLLMYTLLNVEFRYIAAWLILFFVAAYSAFLNRPSRYVGLLLSAVAVLTIASPLGELVKTSRNLSQPQSLSIDAYVAQELQRIGLKPHDRIAIVGEGFTHYYAHIGDLRIIAQVSNGDQFWSLPAERALEVERVIAKTGAKALVAYHRPTPSQPDAWYSLLPLQNVSLP